MGRRFAIAVTGLAAAAAIAGCGSSKKHATAAATTSTETASSSAYAPTYLQSKTASAVARAKTTSTAAKSSAKAAAPTTATTGKVVVVSSAKVGSLGTILVNEKGFTLYTFAPDNRSKVTCTGACATTWPPLVIPPGATVKASGEVKQSLLGSDPDPEGGRVVTYNGWPLYTYVADGSPGMATGQGINLNGGFWYVISPSGQVIH